MEEVFKTKARYNRMLKYKDKIYFFNEKSKKIKVFNIKNNKTRNLMFNENINNISFKTDKLLFFQNEKISILKEENLDRTVVFVFPDCTDVIYLSYNSYIFLGSEKAYFHNDSGNFKSFKLVKYQYIYPYVILVMKDLIKIYKEDTLTSIYSLSFTEFLEKYHMRNNSLFENHIFNEEFHFEIRNNKLYIKYKDRIFGNDLNLYLNDLKKYNYSENDFDRFTNIKNEIILFSKKNSELLVLEKNLMNLIIKLKCKDYIYDEKSDRLYILTNNKFIIYERINIYKAKFNLIDTYVKYYEREDEFDQSDSSYKDFQK